MCRLLEVSTSGFYAWSQREPCKRAQQDEVLLGIIRSIHENSRGTYGAPRIHVELAEQGIRIGCKRVARLMRKAGLQGVSRRKWICTTTRDGSPAAADLVQRDFSADAPDKLWVADITYIPTWAGFLYLAVVLDVFSRRVVGWAMENHLRTELVLAALHMAIGNRRALDVVHHSDHGTQYTSVAFGKRCEELGVRPSMGSVGDCFDNAMCESFFATLECELLERTTLRTYAQARLEIFEFIEGFYNPRRRHSGIGQLSPLEFERRYYESRQPRRNQPVTHRRVRLRASEAPPGPACG
jgi:transposase InsO family protein